MADLRSYCNSFATASADHENDTTDHTVTTAKAVEIAERAARKAAKAEAMPITVMAEAENPAANNKAEAITMLAKADAETATTRAAGVKSLGQAEAGVEGGSAQQALSGDGRLRAAGGPHFHIANASHS
ncbi:hypothetical protein [Bradyrhizobium sp. sGM-13]|uniref:hypothetical protein n=1 Tax=Bradyrhizobium sp. sGM-13 TaxID=2831781 RepID=UPI001BD0C40B|nr:hypothetical protein [Bradyrhizobium sp. sGM-13]